MRLRPIVAAVLLTLASAAQAEGVSTDPSLAPAGAGAFYERCGFTPYGGAVYRGVPLLYFEWRVEGG